MNEQKALVPYQPYHPIYPAPLDRFAEITEKYGLEAWNKLVAARNKRVRLAENDPLEYGYKLDSWREIWSLLEKYSTVAVLGGNRSSKSEFGGNTIGRMMTEGRFFDPPLFRKKLVNVACMFSAERPSWTLQQPYVYRYLPPEIRSSGKSAGGDINYRKGKGFTNNMFVMPNGSQCQFWFYEQEQDLVEGQEFDFVWLDEYLKGTWLDTMNYRVAGINGRILITVTLVHGMTRAVKEIMDTCKVIKTAPVNPALFDEDVSTMHLAKNCPAGHVPVLLADDKKSAAVYFLHSENNPFLDKAAFAKKLAGAPREKVLIRAYGYCDYTATAAFPKFSEKIHVVSREFLRKTAQLQRFTVYHSADPGGGKPWVVKWYAIFENGWTICFWETPQYKEFGPWARPPEKDERNPKWLAGPAQSANPGAGYLRVKRGFRDVETKILPKLLGKDKIDVFARYIDPRMGAQIQASFDDSGTNYIELMREEQIDENGEVVGDSYLFIPSKTSPNHSRDAIESSISLINDKLDYDEDKPLSPENCPSLYFTEDCEQSICAYKNFSATSSPHCALKDFIDPDRYLLNMQPQFVDWESESTRIWTGGY